MRALTVLQPFATALVREGAKTVENRPMRFPGTVSLPAWVAIHAGGRPFPDDDACQWALGQLGAPCPTWIRGSEVARAVLPSRRVVGAVRFVRSDEARLHFDDPWASGPWCWVRDLCVEIEEAPEIRGLQGLWTLSGPTLGLLHEAIAAKYGQGEAARAVAP